MKKQNLLVLGLALLLIAVVAVIAAVVPENRAIPENAPSVQTTETAAAVVQPTEEAAAPGAADDPAAETPVEAYLVVSVQGVLYEPLPLGGEGAFTITQDENTTNTVHVTPTSVWMEHSTCDNQDCVDQGVVSLENMESRVLYNMVICLPNQVVLELHTPETLAEAFGVTE